MADTPDNISLDDEFSSDVLTMAEQEGERNSERDSGPSHGLKRSRRRSLTIGLLSVLVLVMLLVLGTGVVGLWVRHTLSNNIEKIADPFESLSTRAPQTEAKDGEEAPVNILVLGSDSRISAGDPTQWKVGAQRTDAMMIMHISGDRRSVSIMSIPRDSWVQIPGHGEAKINAAFSWGGPSLTIQTVEQVTGIHIDHFAVADFTSFKAMTDELGGVKITLAKEQTLAGEVFPAGGQLLNGEQALAYARERKSLPRGDFDRINRQQAWMRAIASGVFTSGTIKDPVKMVNFLKIATSSMAVDEGFTMDEMQSLAVSLRDVRSDDITFMTAPTAGTGTSDDGQSIVVLDPAKDEPLFAAFQQDEVQAYVQAHPDDVDLLPATAN